MLSGYQLVKFLWIHLLGNQARKFTYKQVKSSLFAGELRYHHLNLAHL